MSLPSDDVSYGSTPSPRIPYRVLGSAHCDHVHAAPPLPLLYRRAVPRAHKHTSTLVVSALPIQCADSGGSGRGGATRAAALLIPALLRNWRLRAFDNLEQSVQKLLQILDPLLLSHVQPLMEHVIMYFKVPEVQWNECDFKSFLYKREKKLRKT